MGNAVNTGYGNQEERIRGKVYFSPYKAEGTHQYITESNKSYGSVQIVTEMTCAHRFHFVREFTRNRISTNDGDRMINIENLPINFRGKITL